MIERHYWFIKRSRDQGWGLEPGSPQGWIATLAFVVIEIAGIVMLRPLVPPWVLCIWAFGWLAAFVSLVLYKGEPL
jgi:hypothetical protein